MVKAVTCVLIGTYATIALAVAAADAADVTTSATDTVLIIPMPSSERLVFAVVKTEYAA